MHAHILNAKVGGKYSYRTALKGLLLPSLLSLYRPRRDVTDSSARSRLLSKTVTVS